MAFCALSKPGLSGGGGPQPRENATRTKVALPHGALSPHGFFDKMAHCCLSIFLFSYAFSLPLSLSLSLAILFFFPLSFGYSSPSRFNSLLARNIDSQPLLAKFGFIAFYLASIYTSFGNEISFHLFFPSFLSFLACFPVDNNIYIYFYLRNYYFFFDFMRREEALPSFLLRVKKYSASRFN